MAKFLFLAQGYVWVKKKFMCQTEKYIAPRRGGRSLYFGPELVVLVLLTFESSKQWLMVFLSLNVLITLQWPLKAKQIVEKITTPVIIGVPIFSSIASIPTLLAWKIIKSPLGTPSCTALGADAWLSFILAFFTTAQKYPISTTIHVILTINIVIILGFIIIIRQT